jgi:HSP20 family protein
MLPTPSHRHPGNGSQLTRQEHPLSELRRGFDSLFSRFFGNWMTPFEDGGSMRFWDFDMQEANNEIIVKAEMPGFDPDEIDVQIHDNVLTIKAEHRMEQGEDRHYNSYRRTVTLPSGIDADKVQGTYRNGVLELHMPRTKDSQGKRIAIQGQHGTIRQETGQAAGSSAQAKPEGTAQEKEVPVNKGAKEKPAKRS